jgi:hypothetical protein
MLDQPRENTRSAVCRSCSSVTFLLMTSRIRCVPASGAKVTPVARTRAMSSSTFSSSPYARRLETPSDTRLGASSSATFFTSGAMHE